MQNENLIFTNNKNGLSMLYAYTYICMYAIIIVKERVGGHGGLEGGELGGAKGREESL